MLLPLLALMPMLSCRAFELVLVLKLVLGAVVTQSVLGLQLS